MSKIAKNNKKTLKAKIKTILAAPDKIICPVLHDEEFQKLKNMLLQAVDKSAQAPLTFAKQHNIRLGLQSTLRAIKQNQMKCVLLAQQLKPRFILGLIYRNAQVVDSNVPVYTHAELAELCESVFGVRAMALAICKTEQHLNNDLTAKMEAWLLQNTLVKATKTIQLPKLKPKVELAAATEVVIKPKVELVVATPAKITKPVAEPNKTALFLSFDSKQHDAVELDLQSEEKCLKQVLQKLSNKAKAENAVVYKPWTAFKVAPNPNKVGKAKNKINKKQKH